MFVTALSEPEISFHLRDAHRLVTDAAYSFTITIALFCNVSLGWLTLL